jgi:hypothetical protein
MIARVTERATGRIFVLMMLAGCGLSESPVDQPPATTTSDGGGGGAAVPAGGVVIGGRPVAKDKVIVFLHIGHSNMAGRAETPESDRPYHYDTHPQLWAYGRGGVWRPAREPLSGDSMTRGRAGPGMSILRTALALAPDAQVVSIGHGHSGQTGGYCRNYRKGGLLYDIVMVPAMELKGRVTFGGIFTMFGISEVNDEENIPRFGECMEAVARDMRADLGEPGLPFLIGEWEAGADGDVGPDGETARAIIPQMKQLPSKITRSVLIPTEGLEIEVDDHHYTMVSHRTWAARGFEALKKANLIPWATTP